MKIATILFTYNRYEHTKKTIEGIKNSTILPETLYIFQDGIDKTTDTNEWEKVNKIIQAIDFCETEVHVSEKRMGLSYSVKTGIGYVMNMNDAAIIFEDDCVPHPIFIEYATSALRKYKDAKNVWSINGYAEDVEVEENGYDAYFSGRTNSWGWATWSNRWQYYEEDYKLLKKIKDNKELYSHYKIWGEDLENYLLGNVEGRCDSWAVFWSLIVIKNKGYCLAPYKSLINNIGFDGSGTHSGKLVIGNKKRNILDKYNISLPEKICYPVNYTEAFLDKFHWTNSLDKLRYYNSLLYKWVIRQPDITAILINSNVRRIAIWGTGKIAELLINKIDTKKIDIIEIIKSKNYTCEKEFNGISVCDFSKTSIKEGADLLIVIPFYDVDLIRKKIAGKGISVKTIGIDRLIEGKL